MDLAEPPEGRAQETLPSRLQHLVTTTLVLVVAEEHPEAPSVTPTVALGALDPRMAEAVVAVARLSLPRTVETVALAPTA